MSEQVQEAPVIKKTKRVHKSGSAAAKQVRRQSKSSAPIFFEKTIVNMVKQHAPEGTRIRPSARRLLRSILEQRQVTRFRKAYAVTKARRGGKGNVRLVSRDLDLVDLILHNKVTPEEVEVPIEAEMVITE